MTAPISVVIPTLNAEAELGGCLAALTPGLTGGLIREVVIVDGGSTDKTILVGYDAGARIILSSAAGRGRQLRTGGLNARGDWILFLHADTQLDADWSRPVAYHLSASSGKAAAFTLRYRSDAKEARWLEKRANLRARLLGLPYGDQGLLISRAMYQGLGGFESLPLMEDVDMIRRIGRKNLTLLDCPAHTSAAKYERDGWRKRAWSNAWLVTRYLAGADPHKLARAYD